MSHSNPPKQAGTTPSTDRLWGILTRFDLHRQTGDMTLGEARREAIKSLTEVISQERNKAIGKDLSFLKEMKERAAKALTNETQYEYLEKMIDDWINELAQLEEEKE